MFTVRRAIYRTKLTLMVFVYTVAAIIESLLKRNA
jgi:hypothetical protein